MPYKNPLNRRRRYRQRRLKDAQWLSRSRSYHREYQKLWYRRNLERQRKYQRDWQRKWRRTHPKKSRAVARQWRRNNPEKTRAQHKRWRESVVGRAWYAKNRSRRRAQQRKYYRKERKRNIEQQRARRRRYYSKNRDKINTVRRIRRARNPAEFKTLDRVRYSKNRLKRIIQQRNTQARRAGAPGEITSAQWLRLLRRHKFRCFYCQVRLLPANRTLDHKVPISRGGANTIHNVVPACRPCNNRKLRMTTEEFIARNKTLKISIALGSR